MNFNIFQLCNPAFAYMLLMLLIIIIDLFRMNIILAIIKLFITAIITFLLNLLCTKNLSIISYIFVFFPLIITSISMIYILFYTGKIEKQNITYEKK